MHCFKFVFVFILLLCLIESCGGQLGGGFGGGLSVVMRFAAIQIFGVSYGCTEMFNLSIVSGLLPLHSSIYLVPRAQSGIQLIEAYRQNTLKTVFFSPRLRLVLKSQLNAKHGCKFYSCKRPSLPPNNITMIDFFLHRSKRGVEKKANYPNIRDKRSPFSMLEKRLPHRGFKPEDKKHLN